MQITHSPKVLVQYHDLYVQSDRLLLADVFVYFWNMYLEIYELDPAHFLTTPGLAKLTKIKNLFILNIGM